ncbi:hypothetical protein DFH07DRAFT_1020087 [Mycena maculata]|uniref:GATA-type domain-containing protein n=1 Tax=Mycena maculata TaxID=230809 RepID=A0AAD7JCE1_9AGAR|nr:hypothetical protein DFH07DRAFT_1020087 [Mycena maculata]
MRRCRGFWSIAQCCIRLLAGMGTASLQTSLPHVQPQAAEVAEMVRRANEVVRLLEELRRFNLDSSQEAGAPLLMANGHTHGGAPLESAPPPPVPAEMDVDAVDQDARPPKRPWEDVDGEEVDELEELEQPPYPTPTDTKASPPSRTTAEADMEIIRTKRAATAVAGTPGGPPKSKYRKRSVSVFIFILRLNEAGYADVRSRDWSGQRATPPGKCHSCHIRETPEWRRGPDGARTLCNACGLHYAKLMRKREKEHGGNGPTIDMDTLRASARADMASKLGVKGLTRGKNAPPPTAAPGQGADAPPQQPPPPPAHHETSFQVTLAGPALSPSEVQAQMHGAAPQAPAWAASAGAPQRAYAPEQLQHQSFMRTGQASPR